MNSVFSEDLLAEKLSKVNSTRHCIETLSHWCIFHRSKAELVVSTWEKQFHSLKMVQKVPLLYLANDFLQNSKRNGNEFVTEFWKALPAALKDPRRRRLRKESRFKVDIWEERRVFGSRARIKEVMLGEEAPLPLEFNGSKKRPRSIKIVKRDSRSIRTKLSVGGTAEKIVSAFHLVLSEQPNEDSEMSKCNAAVNHVRKLGKDIDIACSTAKDPKRKTIAKELEEDENILKQCIEKLKSVKASRLALISQLKEALHEQESELENVRTQVQVAQTQAEEASNMRKRLEDKDYESKPSLNASAESNTKSALKSAAAIAAEVADRLTASTSSQFIMTSVLSTFAAQEAQNAGLTKSSASPDKPVKPVTASLSLPPPTLAVPPNHAYQSVMVPQTVMQTQPLPPSSQVQYHMISNPASQQQYMAPPYGYSARPPPPHMVSPMVPLQMPQITQQQQQAMPLAQQVPVAPTFRPLQPPGMVYYGQSHHSQ